jgi:U3 small nucleolar RNA-associated protein 3
MYIFIETLLNYMTNISFYFALKASGTAELRSHPVIESLVGLRQTLEKMDKIEEKLEDQIEIFVQQLDQAEKPVVQKKKKSDNKNKANRVTFAEPVFDQDEEDEDSEEEDISGLVQTDEESEEESEEEDAIDIEEEFKSLKKAAKLAKKRKRQSTDDFGDLDALDEVDMEDKLTKKRSIRDYIAKIDSVSRNN